MDRRSARDRAGDQPRSTPNAADPKSDRRIRRQRTLHSPFSSRPRACGAKRTRNCTWVPLRQARPRIARLIMATVTAARSPDICLTSNTPRTSHTTRLRWGVSNAASLVRAGTPCRCKRSAVTTCGLLHGGACGSVRAPKWAFLRRWLGPHLGEADRGEGGGLEPVKCPRHTYSPVATEIADYRCSRRRPLALRPG